MGDYTIENIYEPGHSSFTPSESVPHYLGKQNLISAGQMGGHTDPRTANQLSELSHKLNVGAIPMEIGTMDMAIFDTIPKQHFEEIRRKAKLAEAKISMHAPIQDMDPSGFTQEGWQEEKQKLVEHQLKSVIDRAAIIDSKGNMPITIHGSGNSGSTFKMVDGVKQTEMLVAVERDTGKLTPIKESVQFQPGIIDWAKGGLMTPEQSLKSHNDTQWRKEVDTVLFEKETADKMLSENYPIVKEIYGAIKMNPEKSSEIFNNLPQTQKELVSNIQTADAHIHQAGLSVTSLFDKAYQYGGKDEEDKKNNQEKLRKLAEEYDKSMHGGYTSEDHHKIIERAKKNNGRLKSSDEEAYMKIQKAQMDLQTQTHTIQNFAEKLRGFNPQMITPIETFAKEKASETFANVALHSYKQYGEGAPVVSIENLYQGMGFSQTSDLKELVEKSQERFVSKAKEQGINESKAQEMAKKLIGVTFDVGHLNVSKAHGFSDKDLVKEAAEIAKHVKHVHLTDNFGYSDTHLPIGMGNVPVKELLEALGDEGAKARKINEVGGWFQHFKTNPFSQLLEAAGSQVYSSSQGPSWAQAGGFQQSYLEGYGQVLPQTHYQLFGAGFSQLPQTLGGSVSQGGGGRMGGGDF